MEFDAHLRVRRTVDLYDSGKGRSGESALFSWLGSPKRTEVDLLAWCLSSLALEKPSCSMIYSPT